MPTRISMSMVAAARNVAATLIAIGALYWAVNVYESGLRDPRYLDGWILCAGMAAQVSFHIRRSYPGLLPGLAERWLKAHIITGYFVIGAFALHTGYSLPDTRFEWLLWSSFAAVAVSGIAGAYLTWSIPAKLLAKDRHVTFEQIQAQRAALSQEVEYLALSSTEETSSTVISDFYVARLRAFLSRPRNLGSHLRGSDRPIAALRDEIRRLAKYLDDAEAEKLRSIEERVAAKDRLDFQYAHRGLLQIWLFVHIPATYCLLLLTVVHILIVYAFSSGVP